MAGLFDKDLKLLLERKQTIVLFLVIAVILGFSTDGVFVVGYISFCILILTVSTISYDEFDHGLSFLMTLPITRRSYVMEKYVLCIVCGTVAWAFSVVVCIVENQYVKAALSIEELLMQAAAALPSVIVIMDIMIPTLMKYGSEKSRIVMIIIAGIVMIASLGIKKAGEILELPIASILEKLQGITDVQMLIAGIVFTAAATVLSLAVSVKIMNNKEF